MSEKIPEYVIVDFLKNDLSPVVRGDLGKDFLEGAGEAATYEHDQPFCVVLEKRQSKAGNSYFEFSQNGVPFPDGLRTFIRMEGIVLPLGKVHPSKSSGNPTREGEAHIVIGNQLYLATAYLTETKRGYYTKVIAHKAQSWSVKS